MSRKESLFEHLFLIAKEYSVQYFLQWDWHHNSNIFLLFHYILQIVFSPYCFSREIEIPLRIAASLIQISSFPPPSSIRRSNSSFHSKIVKFSYALAIPLFILIITNRTKPVKHNISVSYWFCRSPPFTVRRKTPSSVHQQRHVTFVSLIYNNSYISMYSLPLSV